MSILLTHSYFLYEDDKEANIMKPYAPLGLLYISSYLEKRYLKNKVFDSTFSSPQNQLEYIKKNQPKIVAIYTNLMTKIKVIKLMKELRNNADYGLPTVILGGPDITFNIENYLHAGAHFLVIGEGEETMRELSTAILNNGNTNEINGLAYLKNERVVKTATREKIKDLSELPLPNRAAIDFKPYLDIWKKHHNKNSITVSTQRGCPYTCKWCSTAVYGQSYRRRPAKLVVEELQFIKNTYNPDAIWFVDDVFTVSHKWIQEFVDEIKQKQLKIPFECITRAERLNDTILQLLKEAGCFRIWIGAESGSQKIIDAMDRRVDIDKVKEVIQQTNKMGIETGTFIMLGYPGEDENDINQTIQYLKDANPTQYTITIAYPIKGTALYNEIESEIISDTTWEISTDREIDFKRTYSRKYYDYAVKRIINEVNQHREKQKGNHFVSFKLKGKSIVASIGMKLNR
ncbi:MAG: B12-binding domain-containing radical SAM protein [Flavobacteriaceae bacterium]|nr:MAG: B12-binding domain-containing radical SAM protein [Flavobacteriaceae bacterium]